MKRMHKKKAVVHKGNNAVIYVRVSTDEQAEDALNLSNQEDRCRNYCQQKGLTIVEIFTDAGESARSSDRPAFQRMLSYCRSQRNDVRFVVVQDLSRFARNQRNQAEAIYDLDNSGVSLRSTYESNIDETAAGKLAANLFGSFNQFFSDSHSEKQRDRKRQAIAAGRVPWRAPIGYRNIRAKVGANIEHDEQRAPLIRRAFELVSTGLHIRTEVLKTVTDEGLSTLQGKAVSTQTFYKIMTNPFYAGWITLPIDPNFKPVRGLYEPIVSQETFDRVQAVLAGRKPTTAPRKNSHPDFPLRRFVRCAACRVPLTGAYCKVRFPRYWCRKRGCRSVSVTKASLESKFEAFLGRLRVGKEKAADFPKVAARVWEAKRGGSERNLKKLTSQLEEQKKLKTNFLMMLGEGKISHEDFGEAIAVVSERTRDLEERVRALALTNATADSFVRFAELQLTDMKNVWRMANPEQRERVQNLLFQDGLDYSPESGFLNRSKSSLFFALEAVDLKKSLVEAGGVELFHTL